MAALVQSAKSHMVQKYDLIGGGWNLSSFSSQGLQVDRVTNTTWYLIKGSVCGGGIVSGKN